MISLNFLTAMTLRFFQGHLHSEQGAFTKTFFSRIGAPLGDVSSHLFSQGLKFILVKPIWLYLYWFKSYDRLQVAN
jgi:hypothetical protein